MNIIKRYNKLTIWNKVAFWGSIASIIGFSIMIISYLKPLEYYHNYLSKNDSSGIVSLRSYPSRVSYEDTNKIIKKYGFDHPFDKSNLGLPSVYKGSFKNSFESRNLEGDLVVIDRKTQLMWKKDCVYKDYSPREELDSVLNNFKYAGYSNWRIPTIEELFSLLEFERNNLGYYINSEFSLPDRNLHCCASTDRDTEDSGFWSISYDLGVIRHNFWSYGLPKMCLLIVRSQGEI